MLWLTSCDTCCNANACDSRVLLITLLVIVVELVLTESLNSGPCRILHLPSCQRQLTCSCKSPIGGGSKFDYMSVVEAEGFEWQCCQLQKEVRHGLQLGFNPDAADAFFFFGIGRD